MVSVASGHPSREPVFTVPLEGIHVYLRAKPTEGGIIVAKGRQFCSKLQA